MSDSGPSPEVINYYGRTWMKGTFANTNLTFLETGIQLFMCLYGLFTFLGTPKDLRKGRGRFIVLSFAIFVTSTIPTICDAVDVSTTLLDSGPNGYDLIQLWVAQHEASWKAPFTIAMLYLSIAIGDALMIWRCYVMWQDRKWVTALPILALCGAIACGMSAYNPKTDKITNGALITSSVLLSISVNLMVTFLMVLRLVKARSRMEKALNPGTKPSPMYSSTIAILIESAAPLAVVGIPKAITSLGLHSASDSLIVTAHWGIADNIFAVLYYSFCALSPQMIIFRVTTGRSWKNVAESRHGVTVVSQPLQFARDDASSEARDSLSNV
ncbi:hypothetical protein BKA70DRAFT_1103325 [Coprinopsis sp. MPI-PUGE-AT-0042]|nr:hypothetical protein BKA70DRAFT_1103325 [Coprinopsis sp. MPI-PUGE-AT-0042]